LERELKRGRGREERRGIHRFFAETRIRKYINLNTAEAVLSDGC